MHLTDPGGDGGSEIWSNVFRVKKQNKVTQLVAEASLSFKLASQLVCLTDLSCEVAEILWHQHVKCNREFRPKYQLKQFLWIFEGGIMRSQKTNKWYNNKNSILQNYSSSVSWLWPLSYDYKFPSHAGCLLNCFLYCSSDIALPISYHRRIQLCLYLCCISGWVCWDYLVFLRAGMFIGLQVFIRCQENITM